MIAFSGWFIVDSLFRLIDILSTTQVIPVLISK